MKVIIAGGRDYKFTDEDREFLNSIGGRISEVVSGACQAKKDSDTATGADGFGEEWAKENKVPVTRFYPDWKTYGRGAGPKRNISMAEYAEAVVLFPGGRGTDSMHREASKRQLEIYDRRKQ